KAFDNVHRETLWNITKIYGIPRYIVFKNIYLNSRCCVKTDTGVTNYFTIVTGMSQLYIVTSPVLLVIDFNAEGTQWTEQASLTDLDIAYNIALLAEVRDGLQQLTTNLEKAARKVGLRMSVEKTKVMQISDDQVIVQIPTGQQLVDDVDCFTYPGTVLTKENDLEKELNRRIGKVVAVFQRMHSIWSSTAINIDSKIHLYKTVQYLQIYASETWKRTSRIAQKLKVFQQWCL
uniref:Reverse transcriptase domain-containing protein n=1 Tax=Lepisosteus oculatus TaxID=7918 RepID=W5MRK2_LEPOC